MRKNVGIICEKQDLDSIVLIQNKISCASQACSIGSIPEGIEDRKIKLYIQAAIDSLATYQWLEKDWWDRARLKYKLPSNINVWIDFNNNQFYIEE